MHFCYTPTKAAQAVVKGWILTADMRPQTEQLVMNPSLKSCCKGRAITCVKFYFFFSSLLLNNFFVVKQREEKSKRNALLRF